MVITELSWFLVTKAHLQNHNSHDYNINQGFKNWFVEEGNKICETDDDFQLWDTELNTMILTGKTLDNKTLNKDSSASFHITKSKDDAEPEPKKQKTT